MTLHLKRFEVYFDFLERNGSTAGFESEEKILTRGTETLEWEN